MVIPQIIAFSQAIILALIKSNPPFLTGESIRISIRFALPWQEPNEIFILFAFNEHKHGAVYAEAFYFLRDFTVIDVVSQKPVPLDRIIRTPPVSSITWRLSTTSKESTRRPMFVLTY
jgi:hypothetical protein